MSVDRTRQLMEKRGCITFVLIGIAVLMGLSMMSGQCSRANNSRAANGQSTDAAPENVVAKVGDSAVTLQMINDGLAAKMRNMGAQAAGMTPAGEFISIAQEVKLATDSAISAEFGKSQGVELDDEKILDWVGKSYDRLMAQARIQAEIDGKLKKNSTEAEWAAYVKTFTKKDLKESREAYLEQAKRFMQDPTQRLSQYGFVAKELIKDRIEKDYDVSEEAAKKAYDDLVFQRIYFGSVERQKMLAKAADTLAKIRAGGNFEALIDELSQDSPDQGKKKSQSFTRLTQAAINSEPGYAPLKTLKPGEISDVVDTPAGPAIYKLVRKESKVPADWEKNKLANIRSFREETLGKAVNDLEEKFKSTTKIEWKSPALEFAYHYLEFMANPAIARLPEADQKKAFEEQLAKASALKDKELLMPKAAVYAKYAIFDTIYQRAKPEEKKALADERIKLIQEALQFTEQPALRIELVELLAAKKDPSAAVELVTVSQTNNAFNPLGDFVNGKVSVALKNLIVAKMITPEQEASIRENQRRLESEKAELAKQQAAANAPPGVKVEQPDPNDPAFQKAKAEYERQTKAKRDAEAKAKANPLTAPRERSGGR